MFEYMIAQEVAENGIGHLGEGNGFAKQNALTMICMSGVVNS